MHTTLLESGSARAYEFVRQGILSGELQPGAVLLERELAEQTGLSRTPIREALKALQAAGFVRINPNRGASVAELAPHDVRDLYDTRSCIECHAIRKGLAESGQLDVSALAESAVKQRDALEREDVQGVLAMERTFHMTLLRFHQNGRLEAIMENVWDHLARAAFLGFSRRVRQEASLTEHLQIIEALKGGDADEAVAAIALHNENSVRRVLLG